MPTPKPSLPVRPESIPVPDGKTEVRGIRSVNSKTFVDPDGRTHTCEIRMGAVCYCDDTGDLRSIDTTIRDLDGTWGVDWAPYKFRLHSDAVGFDVTFRDGGSATITLEAVGGQPITRPDPVITDNTLTFPDVSSGVDIVIVCQNDRVKTLRIIKDAEAARTFDWRIKSDRTELIDATLTGLDSARNQLDLTSEVKDAVIHEAWSGQVKLITDPATRIKTLSDKVEYPVTIDPTVNVSVAANADDGWENADISYWYGSSNYAYFGHYGGNRKHIGMRFSSVLVPQGATITSATATMKVRYRVSSAAGKLYGRLATNPAAFDSSNRPSNVTKTTAYTAIAAIASTGVKNYDVTTAIQEIVNQGGFSSGNAMALCGISTSAAGTRASIEAKEAGAGNQPSLSITYTVASGARTAINTLLGVG